MTLPILRVEDNGSVFVMVRRERQDGLLQEMSAELGGRSTSLPRPPLNRIRAMTPNRGLRILASFLLVHTMGEEDGGRGT